MTNLFTSTEPSLDPLIDETKDYFAELVGEGKKFKTEKELARGKAEADAFIERLTNEMSSLREELKTRATLQEFIDRMSQNNTSQTPTGTQPPVSSEGVSQPTSAMEIQKMVDEQIAARELQRTTETNLEFVDKQMRQAFSNPQAEIQKRAQELGMPLDILKNLAANQPNAFLKLMDAKPQNSTTNNQVNNLFTPISTVNRPVTQVGGELKNWSYYQKQLKENPKLASDATWQREQFESAMKLGLETFNT